ncbi:alpha/beta hydrolase [Paracoccus aminophilus]|uniref:Arylformamidase n=1 Tax=Paracoccus aminophilus JCM 7686 TaxID=1367847 RepID=S5XUZ2_PARAH|nr:alpha/beta hydrolase [Paracoccus aminophilus]AGT11329.1 arylformamidase [Paracoccus aminophilus JCM 7686]
MQSAIDWNDAFRNSAYIPGSEVLPALWARNAEAYRASQPGFRENIAYGPNLRERFDLVMPDRAPEGLVVFVHGGYWTECDKSDWSDLAEGARARGWAMAIPGYTLAPEASLAEITAQITAAIIHAASLVAGPIRLVGHSAGGHLVTRMICDDSGLPNEIAARLERTLSISGLYDLRPFLYTSLNDALGLSMDMAVSESPCLHLPRAGAKLTCWVGAGERPEFLRQTQLMALLWCVYTDLEFVIEPEQNHYSILAGLKDPSSALIRALFDDR